MIEKTGGSLRDLFAVIRDAATRARRRRADRIEGKDAEVALNALESVLTKRIIKGNRRNIEDRKNYWKC